MLCKRGFHMFEAAVSLSLVLICLAFGLQAIYASAENYRAGAEFSDRTLKAFLESERQVWASCQQSPVSECVRGFILPLRAEAEVAQQAAAGGYCVNRIVLTPQGTAGTRRCCR